MCNKCPGIHYWLLQKSQNDLGMLQKDVTNQEWPAIFLTIQNSPSGISAKNDHTFIKVLQELLRISNSLWFLAWFLWECRFTLSMTWGWFNIKIPSYQYRKFHCGDKKILKPPYLHNGISYTGKTSLYWIRTLGHVSIWRPSFPGMVIPMVKKRQSWARLIFSMGIPILVRRHLYIETAPWLFMNSAHPSATYMCQWTGLALAYSVRSHNLNQCSLIVNWTLGNKLQWNLN